MMDMNLVVMMDYLMVVTMEKYLAAPMAYW
jgi:hypothetical protein